jgi:23S rRNA pseudouridine955/2504/2580 synthase
VPREPQAKATKPQEQPAGKTGFVAKPTRKSGYAALKELAASQHEKATHTPNRATHAKRENGRIEDKPKAAAPANAPDAPRVRQHQVDSHYAGQRLDNYLLRELKGAPKSLIYRILRSGEVRVNGGRAKPDYRLLGTETLRIPPLRLSAPQENNLQSFSLDWLNEQIIYEDKSLIVLNKPSGLASHGGSGLSFGAIEAMRSLRPSDQLELVHRLDRDTSGILLIAKKRSQLKFLQAAMVDGEVTKRYLALVKGLPEKDQFKANFSLSKNELKSGERVVKVDEEGKASLTFFRVQERYTDCALVQAELGSGRTHQIRVHAQALGHCLACDDKYGDETFNATLRARGLKRLFLHAASIAWKQDGQVRSYTCELPEELTAVLKKC